MRFYKRSIWGAFACLVAVALVLSACGSDEAEPTATSAPPTAAPTATRAATSAPVTPATAAPTATPTPVPPTPTPAPRLGGTLITRLNADPVEWDAHIRRSNDSYVRSQPLISNLVRFNAHDSKVTEPDLAESYQQSADGTTWTFKIRQNVKWHDGKPLTTADVVYSMLRMAKRQPTFVPLLSGVFASVDTVTSPDPTTVVVKLSYPTLVFFNGLLSTHAVVLPQHIGENFNKTPIASGAFKLGEIKPSNVTSLTKNADYFFPGKPYLDQIDYFTIADNSAALAAFQTGRLHWSGNSPDIINQSNEAQVKSSLAGVQIFKQPSGTFISWLNTVVPAFNDPRVRRAIHLAYDRPEFVAVGLYGDGNPYVIDAFPSTTIWGAPADFVKTLPGYRSPKSVDLNEARSLMEAAGYNNNNRLKTSILTIGSLFGEQAAVAATQLRNIYIDAAVEAVDGATSTQRQVAGNYQIAFLAAAGTIDDPAGVHARFFLPGASGNYAKHNIPAFNELYAKQERLTNVDERLKVVREMEMIALDNAWWAFVAERTRTHGAARQVRNMPAGLGGTNSNMFRFEQVWLQP